MQQEQTVNQRKLMINHSNITENGSALSIQVRTSNPQRKGAWRQYAILAVTLSAASVQGDVIVNNLNQPVSGWDGPIGTNANASGYLLAQ